MALLQCNFYSDVLGTSTSMNVLLPESANNLGEHGCPVLYLLHGYSDDHTAWCRRSSIERYVSNLGIAVVMPNVHKSFYANMVHGDAYWDFISDELPKKVHSLFRVSNRRKDNFVAGLSMGGYGAFKLALRCPRKFAAAASLSGALNIDSEESAITDIKSEQFSNIFGEKSISESDSDLITLTNQYIKTDKMHYPVRFFQCCGTDDYLYEENLFFRENARNKGLELTYEEESGNHNWEYWDHKIQRVLQWMLKPKDFAEEQS